MKKILTILLLFTIAAAFTATLEPGRKIDGIELLKWTSHKTRPEKGPGGIYRDVVVKASPDGFCRVTAEMPENSLGKCYELTVNAASTTSSAQVILTEGFIWGSRGKVQRLFRKRFAGDNEYAEYRLDFKVEKLPFYINFGILPDKKGEMRIAWLELKEISESKLNSQAGKNVEFPKDMNRYEMLSFALKRYNEAQKKVPEQFRSSPPEIALANNEESMKKADKQIGELEKILVLHKDGRNPAKLKSDGGALQLQFVNRHAPHSIWARLEFRDDAEYRIIAPDGRKYRLNQGDLVLLPTGEAIPIEIGNITGNGELKIYPLDHFSSDCWNIIEVDL